MSRYFSGAHPVMASELTATEYAAVHAPQMPDWFIEDYRATKKAPVRPKNLDTSYGASEKDREASKQYERDMSEYNKRTKREAYFVWPHYYAMMVLDSKASEQEIITKGAR